MSRCQIFLKFLSRHLYSIFSVILIIVVTITFYSLAGAVITILAGVAYIKSRDFYKQNEANLLLRIDEKWGSPEIIEARIVIHQLYLRAKEKNKEISEFPKGKYENAIIKEIGTQITQLSKDEGKKKDFIYLLNFLDFMETIGYLCSEKHITAKALNELCGESLKYNYQIFKAYIDYRNSKHTGNFYCEFEKLYKTLRKELDKI